MHLGITISTWKVRKVNNVSKVSMVLSFAMRLMRLQEVCYKLLPTNKTLIVRTNTAS